MKDAHPLTYASPFSTLLTVAKEQHTILKFEKNKKENTPVHETPQKRSLCLLQSFTITQEKAGRCSGESCTGTVMPTDWKKLPSAILSDTIS